MFFFFFGGGCISIVYLESLLVPLFILVLFLPIKKKKIFSFFLTVVGVLSEALKVRPWKHSRLKF